MICTSDSPEGLSTFSLSWSTSKVLFNMNKKPSNMYYITLTSTFPAPNDTSKSRVKSPGSTDWLFYLIKFYYIKKKHFGLYKKIHALKQVAHSSFK
jgi:hypothetical protein